MKKISSIQSRSNLIHKNTKQQVSIENTRQNLFPCYDEKYGRFKYKDTNNNNYWKGKS